MHVKTVCGIFLGITGISSFIGLIIAPIFYRIFIIPKLERRIGHKLQYNPAFNYFLFGNFIYAPVDISLYLVARYISLKLYNDQYKKNLSSQNALQRVSYDVRQSSNLEIYASFAYLSFMILSVFGLISAWLITKLYP